MSLKKMRISHSDKKTVVISMGDPAGIGPEVTLKALKKLKHAKAHTFIVVGDYKIFQKTAKILRINISSFYPPKSKYYKRLRKIRSMLVKLIDNKCKCYHCKKIREIVEICDLDEEITH